jgi:hypothetical protein
MSLTFAQSFAVIMKNVSPLRGSYDFLTFSQGSAALHPGLTSGHPSGVLVHRAASDIDNPKVSDIK